jgi:hypothetical protein
MGCSLIALADDAANEATEGLELNLGRGFGFLTDFAESISCPFNKQAGIRRPFWAEQWEGRPWKSLSEVPVSRAAAEHDG